jgi:hypothetical protein
MTQKTIFLFILMCLFLSVLAQPNLKKHTLINQVRFHDGTLATDYPGCSFLIEFDNELLAVTCKHSLWIAKMPNQKYVHDHFVDQWRMHRKDDTSKFLVAGKLINKNHHERIFELNTEQDYLIFPVVENHSDIVPLQLEGGQLKKGEKLYTIGWAFKDRGVPQQVYESVFVKQQNNALLTQYTPMVQLAGASGSPVVNQAGRVVGIVSSWKQDGASGQWYAAPCSVECLWEELFRYWCGKHNEDCTLSSFMNFKNWLYKDQGTVFLPSVSFFMRLFYEQWGNADADEYSKRLAFVQHVEKETGRHFEISESLKSYWCYKEWERKFLANKVELADLVANKGAKVSWEDLVALGYRLLDGGFASKSIEVFQFTVEMFGQFGPVYSFLADAQLAMGERGKAIENYKKCLKLYPGYPFAKEQLERLE